VWEEKRKHLQPEKQNATLEAVEHLEGIMTMIGDEEYRKIETETEKDIPRQKR
jgi:hypothetical protein